MTADSDRPEDQVAPGRQASPDAGSNEEPPAAPTGSGVVARRPGEASSGTAGTGEGGPSQVDAAAQEIASGSRPPAPPISTPTAAPSSPTTKPAPAPSSPGRSGVVPSVQR